MKRALLLLLLLALAMPAALAAGDFSRVAGTYELSSGVGAWYTELHVSDDGSFTGHYQDLDMGDVGDLNGTPYQGAVYQCDFTGQLSAPEFIGDYEIDCTIQTLDREELPTWVADGVLNVFTSPSGLNARDKLRFFLEGAATADLPEGFLVWVRMREGGVRWESLPYNGIYNETADAGFSGSGDASGIIWLPDGEDTASGGSGQWEFVTGDDGDAPAPRATAVPSALSAGEADEGEEEAVGISYPVQAEVVNCQTGVSLRSQPSTKSELLAEVPLGALVSVHSNKAWLGNDRWFVEASYNGQQGYICVEYLDVILPDDLSYRREYLKGLDGFVSAVNPGSDLVLRDGPGKDYDSLGLLFGGEVLGYKGEAKKDAAGTCWYRCSHYGEDCWISAKYTVLTTNDGKSYTGSRGIY